jgi:hypothetical protein
MVLENRGFQTLSVRVMKTGLLVGEEIRARLKRTIMQGLGIKHAWILAAADCLGQEQREQRAVCLTLLNKSFTVAAQI